METPAFPMETPTISMETPGKALSEQDRSAQQAPRPVGQNLYRTAHHDVGGEEPHTQKIRLFRARNAFLYDLRAC
jgi:hypothetical protein